MEQILLTGNDYCATRQKQKVNKMKNLITMPASWDQVVAAIENVRSTIIQANAEERFEQIEVINNVPERFLYDLKQMYEPYSIEVSWNGSETDRNLGTIVVTTLALSPMHARMLTMVTEFTARFVRPFGNRKISNTQIISSGPGANVNSDAGITVPREGSLVDDESSPGARVFIEIEYHHRSISQLHDHMRQWMHDLPQLQVGIAFKVEQDEGDPREIIANAMVYYRNLGNVHITETHPDVQIYPTCVAWYRFGTLPENQDEVLTLQRQLGNPNMYVAPHNVEYGRFTAASVPGSNPNNFTISISAGKVFSNVDLDTQWVIDILVPYNSAIEDPAQRATLTTIQWRGEFGRLPNLEFNLTDMIAAYLDGVDDFLYRMQRGRIVIANVRHAMLRLLNWITNQREEQRNRAGGNPDQADLEVRAHWEIPPQANPENGAAIQAQAQVQGIPPPIPQTPLRRTTRRGAGVTSPRYNPSTGR